MFELALVVHFEAFPPNFFDSKGKNMNTRLTAAAVALLGASFLAQAQAATTLDTVKARGHLVCGVNTSAPGFSSVDSKGNWSGLDVDVCRAVAAATLGDASKVKFVPLSSPQRFSALQAGEIDVLARNTTWTMTRDTTTGSVFTVTTYYDGQGFMVPKKLKVKSAAQLRGATICVQSGTSSEKSLADYFAQQNIKFRTVVFDTTEATQAAFFSGRCQAYTTDMSDLAGARTNSPNPADYEILPDVISKEPLAPAVRRGDDQWLSIVRWSIFAMLNAEELGLTKANVDEKKKGDMRPDVQRLLGAAEDMGKALGLDSQWSYNIIKQVGNYGESFEANMGPNSKLGLPRGVNNLWTQGGLMYAPPVR